MLAVGCLFPFMLALGGAIVGGTHGGAQESLIGAIVGLLAGGAIPGVAFLIFSRMNRTKDRS